MTVFIRSLFNSTFKTNPYLFRAVMTGITSSRIASYEAKACDREEEKSLQDTVEAALKQIDRMQYEADLLAEGLSKGRIRKYGFGFEGKRVLIG